MFFTASCISMCLSSSLSVIHASHHDMLYPSRLKNCKQPGNQRYTPAKAWLHGLLQRGSSWLNMGLPRRS